ncbi:MAG: carboxypeptidase-like regulatory domain-containing protein, partial [Acidobacteriota bacterium]
MSNWLRRAWLLIPVLLLSLAVANAQQLTATLNGIVTDPKDARIPGAKVVVKNDATGDIRTTTA